MNVRSSAIALLIVLGIMLLAAPSARAAEGGYTNYIPGLYGSFAVAVAPEPGFYLLNDIYYYTADEPRVVQFGELRLGLDLEMATYLLTGLKVFDFEILGGRYAAGAMLPVVYGDIEATVGVGPLQRSVSEDRTAIGDLTLIPLSLFWNFDKFHVNFYETIVAPTGSYDKDRNIDAGLNYWSFDTNLAVTYLHEERGHDVSVVLGHIYNKENDDTDYQTGQEFHLDYMLNQFVAETFALGVQGFYCKQVTGDSGSGAILGDFKGEAAGIGPAVLWVPQVREKELMISAKWLHEYHAENRLEGDHVFLNVTVGF
jgi:hypothetical protein